jgi:hypothetical protein
VRIVATAAGRGSGRLRLTSAGQRTLRRAGTLSVLVRGTVTGAGGHATLTRSFLLRR